MGLDMSIYLKANPNSTIALLDKLEDKDKPVEVAYWRKFYKLQDTIAYIIMEDTGKELENCGRYNLSRDNLIDIIAWLDNSRYDEEIDEYHRGIIDSDIIILNKLVEETDFETQTLYYSGWW